MTWFRVDDSFADHDKVAATSDAAIALWVRAGSWAARMLTDGRVPARVVAYYGSTEAAEELAVVGLWVVHPDGGWLFHDWAEYQRSRAEVMAERERWKRDKQRRRGTSAAVSPMESTVDTSWDSDVESTLDGSRESRKGRESTSSSKSPVPSGTARGNPPGSPPWTTDAGQKAPKPRWCGYCDEKTRLVEDPLKTTEDKTVLTRCPVCHPDVVAKWSNAAYAKGIPEPVPEHQRAANHDADEDTDGGALRARLAAKRDQTEPSP